MRPAFFVTVRAGKALIPLPYFALWLIALPLALLAWPVGMAGSLVGGGFVFRALSQAPRLWLILCCLHGFRMDVRSDENRIYLSFV